MNLTLKIPDLGFAPTQQIEEELLDGQTTGVFVGTGSNFIELPGCLEVHKVRMPGLIHEEGRVDEVPLDGSERPRYLAFEKNSYRLIRSIAGKPLLQRASHCNDGIWQKGAQVFVTGRWEPGALPQRDGPITVPEPNSPRVGVEAGDPAESATRGRSRATADAKE